MFRAACRLFHRVCHKYIMFRAACRLFHRVCHKYNMFRAACRLFHRVCHQHNMSRTACRLFYRAYHQHKMSRAACIEIGSQSATNTTCPGLHADSLTESASNNNMFRTACRLFHRVCHQHNMFRPASSLFHSLPQTCLGQYVTARCSFRRVLPQTHVWDSM